MKKKINVDVFASTLRGESVFFPTKDEKPAPDEAGEPLENKDHASQQENKFTSLQGNQKTSLLDSKETGKQVFQETSKRVTYPKVTYQLNPTVTNLLQDTKIALQRHYNVKVSLAEIVEEAIQRACTDLQENKETSFLVSLFTRKQENK